MSTQGPLASAASRCLRSFHQLNSALKDPSHCTLMPPDAVEKESDRFKIWSGNLGALHSDTSSLDYRLRESTVVRGHIERLLDRLALTLTKSTEIANGSRIPLEQLQRPEELGHQSSGDDDSDSGESAGTNDEMPTELGLHMSAISESLNDLYKLSFRIRNPASKPKSLKALLHKEIDEDSGCDVFSAYAEFDKKHVEEAFLQLRRDQANERCRNLPEVERRKAVENESVLVADDNYLVERLAGAITMRRRIMRYRQRHEKKLSATPRDIGRETQLPTNIPLLPQTDAQMIPADGLFLTRPAPTATVKTILSKTEATGFDRALDTVSVLDAKSVISYSTTSYEQSPGSVPLPEPPAASLKGPEFLCPYCGIVCPSRVAKGRAWRSHVTRDLQPYVCTYPACAEPLNLFADRNAWAEHERLVHRRVWQCYKHAEPKYPKATELRGHLVNEHHEDLTDVQIENLLALSESTIEDTRGQCPICHLHGPFPQDLTRHLLTHLEAFAVFSISNSITHAGDNNDDPMDEARSGEAQGLGSRISLRSQPLTFESPLSLPSMSPIEAPPVSGEMPPEALLAEAPKTKLPDWDAASITYAAKIPTVEEAVEAGSRPASTGSTNSTSQRDRASSGNPRGSSSEEPRDIEPTATSRDSGETAEPPLRAPPSAVEPAVSPTRLPFGRRRKRSRGATQSVADRRQAGRFKVRNEYLDVETLRYFRVPFDDKSDPEFVNVLLDMDEGMTDILFDHTRRHRQSHQIAERPEYFKVSKKYLDVDVLKIHLISYDDKSDPEHIIVLQEMSQSELDDLCAQTRLHRESLKTTHEVFKVSREHLEVESLKYYRIPYDDVSDPKYIIVLQKMSDIQLDTLFAHTRLCRHSRPTSDELGFFKVSREYLDVDTLQYYQIPYDNDSDPDFIIILRGMDGAMIDTLFEHTRRLRSFPRSVNAAEAPQKRVEEEPAAIEPEPVPRPIKFTDALGRKFRFPYGNCKTWKEMEILVKHAFYHVENLGPHVMEGHYDLVGPDKEIILPQVWDTAITPGMEIEMQMWPIPELVKKDPDKREDSVRAQSAERFPLGLHRKMTDELRELLRARRQRILELEVARKGLSETGPYVKPLFRMPLVPRPPVDASSKRFQTLLHSLHTTCLKWEDRGELDEAVDHIPLDRIYQQAGGMTESLTLEAEMLSGGKKLAWGYMDCVVMALLRWFKNDFFTWVNNPGCAKCGAPTTACGMAEPSPVERSCGAARVELYLCTNEACHAYERFPRYNDAAVLLQTRRGRVGEWVNCFGLICRAVGSRVRWVWNSEDYVWIEHYSDYRKRWVHVDPCEEAFDKPQLYTEGWQRRLGYCIAFSVDGAYDVTGRYVRDSFKYAFPRTRTSEAELAYMLANLRALRRQEMSARERFRLEGEDKREARSILDGTITTLLATLAIAMGDGREADVIPGGSTVGAEGSKGKEVAQ